MQCLVFALVILCGFGATSSFAQPASDAPASSPVAQPSQGASEVIVVVDKDGLLKLVHARSVNASNVELPLDQLLRLGGHATENDQRDIIHSLIKYSFGFVGGSLVIIIAMAIMVRAAFWRYAAQLGPNKWRTYLLQLPLGAPEGSVRALLSLFVVVFGIVVIALQHYLGLSNVDAIAGFVGSVITFYFTARSSEQARKAAQQTQETLSATVSQTTEALKKTSDDMANAQRDLSQQVLNHSTDLVNTAMQTTARAVAKTSETPTTDSETAASPAATELAATIDKLKDIQLVVRGVRALGLGSDVLPNAANSLASVSDMIDRIEPLLSGKPDPAAVANVLQDVTSKLPALNASGLPGMIAEAAQVLGSVGAPIVAGLPGGPVGIAGGILVAAIRLASNAPQLARFKAALLGQPFDPVLLPDVVDPNIAQAVLEAAPLMSLHFSNATDDGIKQLMRLAVGKKEDGTHFNAADLAELCVSDITAHTSIKLPPRSAEFESQDELMQAFDEYLGALVRINASNQLTDSITVPAATFGDAQGAATIGLQALANAGFHMASDPKAAAQLERLVYLGEALGKLPVDPSKAINLVGEALTAVAQGGLVQDKESEQ
jgi:hypothetical protein